MTSNRLHRGATGLIYAILCGAFAAELRASTAYVISNGSDQLGTVDLAIGVFTLISSTAGSLAGIAANDLRCMKKVQWRSLHCRSHHRKYECGWRLRGEYQRLWFDDERPLWDRRTEQ
jgi:hypothetical protein